MYPFPTPRFQAKARSHRDTRRFGATWTVAALLLVPGLAVLSPAAAADPLVERSTLQTRTVSPNVPTGSCGRGYPLLLQSAENPNQAAADLYGGATGWCVVFAHYADPAAGASATQYVMTTMVQAPERETGRPEKTLAQACNEGEPECVTVNERYGTVSGAWPSKDGNFWWSLRMNKLDSVLKEEWRSVKAEWNDVDEICFTDPDESADSYARVVASMGDPVGAPRAGTFETPPPGATRSIGTGVGASLSDWIGILIDLASIYVQVCIRWNDTFERNEYVDVYNTALLNRDVNVPVAPVLSARIDSGDLEGRDTWDWFEEKYRRVAQQPYDAGAQTLHLVADRSIRPTAVYDTDLSRIDTVVPQVIEGGMQVLQGYDSVRFTMDDNWRSEAYPVVVVDWEAPEGLNLVMEEHETGGPPGVYAHEGRYGFGTGEEAIVRFTYDAAVGDESPGVTARVLWSNLDSEEYKEDVTALWEDLDPERGGLATTLGRRIFVPSFTFDGFLPSLDWSYASPFTLQATADPAATGDAAVANDAASAHVTFEVVPNP